MSLHEPAWPKTMASPPEDSQGSCAGRAESHSGRLLKGLFLPSLTDVLFVALLAVLFLAGKYGMASLLADGDTGWHIRTGEYILETGQVPREDLYSFTKPGSAWYAWEWLSDLVLGFAYRWGGLKGVALLGAGICCLASVMVFRFALSISGGVFVSLGLALLATGVAGIHFLSRPHIFTLLLLPLFLWTLMRDRRQHTAWVWGLIPLTAVWTNLHGGFLGGVASVFVFAAGAFGEGLLDPAHRRAKFQSAARYAALGSGCLAASLLNPYGWRLQVHLYHYLRSDWIREVVEEFQAPKFRTESEFQFEILLLLGLAGCGLLVRQNKLTEALLLLFWAHFALHSIRHATLYGFTAAPLLAGLLAPYWRRVAARAGGKSVVGILAALEADFRPAFRRPSLWCPAVLVLSGLLEWPVAWPKSFPAEVFPLESVNRHRELLASSRVLTTDEWGDYLIFVNYPRQRVFIDGRTDFYGPEVGNHYLAIYQARHDWQALLDRYHVEVVFIPVHWPLGTVMKMASGWRLEQDDGKTLLFVRSGPDKR